MLPSQIIELKIYKRIKSLGPKAVSMNLGMLSQATGEDGATIVDCLKALEADIRIHLSKFSGGSTWPRRDFGSDEQNFFYTGAFFIEIVPQARKYFEQLEQESDLVPPNPLVFISCGQYSPNEIALGKKLAAAVSEFTAYEAYFAENQNSLLGLSNHIFKALNRCAYFVAVMHHRGKVETLTSTHRRASIWIEQEIAIAAFLTEIRNKEIPVILYIQKGIKREGIREQLKLNPVEFISEDDVLKDFISRLKDGVLKISASQSITSASEKPKRDLLREPGEELYSVINAWLSAIAGHFLQRSLVMQGKLTYNQCLDMDIAQGNPPYDFSRIQLLIDLDFPSARDLYDKLIAELTNLNKIEAAFKRSYEEGNLQGDEFLPVYVRTQQSIEKLGEMLQKHILKTIRSMKS